MVRAGDLGRHLQAVGTLQYLVTIGRVLVHLEAFVFVEAPALGQDGGVYAHFADIVQLGAVVNLFAKNPGMPTFLAIR